MHKIEYEYCMFLLLCPNTLQKLKNISFFSLPFEVLLLSYILLDFDGRLRDAISCSFGCFHVIGLHTFYNSILRENNDIFKGLVIFTLQIRLILFNELLAPKAHTQYKA